MNDYRAFKTLGRSLAFALATILSWEGAAFAAPVVFKPDNIEEIGSCAERYGEPGFVSHFKGGLSGDRILRDVFKAKSGYGEKNLAIADEGQVLRVTYPEGSTAPSAKGRPLGGAGFYANAGFGRGVQRACLTYLVRFPDSFDFVRGGKLPGLYGGKNPPSGGLRPKGDGGFTVRLMWREGGRGELYLYVPNMRRSSRGGGMRLGTGAFRFEKGRWTQLEVEVALNDPGMENGLIILRVEDALAIAVKDVRFRDTDKITVDGMMFSTFFGGMSAQFAPKRTQTVDFKDFRVYAP